MSTPVPVNFSTFEWFLHPTFTTADRDCASIDPDGEALSERLFEMRTSRLTVCVPLVALMLGTRYLAAQDPSTPVAYDLSRLNDYAAQVSWRFVRNDGSRTWVCRGEGSAVFLGGNRLLTAAHVIDQNPLTDECAEFGTADPVVEFGSARLQAKVTKIPPWVDEGGLTYPEGMDLALVEVDARMIPVDLRSSPALAVCDADPLPFAPVRIATEYGVYAAQTLPRINEEFARIDLTGKRGFSGSGIFDPTRGCLLGIVSNGGPNGTNYVTNDVVRRFLAGPPALSSNDAKVRADDRGATNVSGAYKSMASGQRGGAE